MSGFFFSTADQRHGYFGEGRVMLSSSKFSLPLHYQYTVKQIESFCVRVCLNFMSKNVEVAATFRCDTSASCNRRD